MSGTDSISKLTHGLATAISVSLHPLVMAVLMFAYLPGRAGMSGWPYAGAVGFFLFFSFLAPFLYLKYQQSQGVIDDIDIRDREKRQNHYTNFLVIYAIQLVLTVILFDSPLLWVYAFGYLANTAIYAQINRIWKISIHGAGLGGPTGVLIYLEGLHVWPLSFIILPLMWSRVKLKYHTPLQVITGALLGGLLIYGEYSLANRIWSFSG